MRFDDSLTTVLSAAATPGFGARATWRQLVDLIGRRRVADEEPAIARLRLLRPEVPTAVRAASARALAFAAPPARLIGFFAEDELAIAAPVLRTASLDDDAWLDLLPRLGPAHRSVLRHRRDLAAPVVRALEAFGAIDFVLSDNRAATADELQPGGEPEEGARAAADPVEPAPVLPVAVAVPDANATPSGSAAPSAPLSDTPFRPLGSVARDLPLVAEALRRADAAPQLPPPAASPAGGYAIADLVARIDAFQRDRGAAIRAVGTTPPLAVEQAPAAADFRWETDASGTIRWVDGVPRGPLIGASLEHAAPQGLAELDGIAAGAFRRRTSFSDARLEIGGLTTAAGSWRMSGVPVFDDRTGRFTGFRGTARRPRADESATPATGGQVADSLRQLVHELRTPANAIAGFAELIETELLGAVPEPYRTRAAAIRLRAGDLIGAIDDLDTAARIDARALALRPVDVPGAPMLERIVADLAPLAALRGAQVTLTTDPAVIHADDRAVERLLGRLLSAVVSAAAKGEAIGVALSPDESGRVLITVDRPAALVAEGEDALPSVDAESEAEAGAPLLGTGFALRLAQNLAVELGGSLALTPLHLRVLLPGAEGDAISRASSP